MSYQHNDKSNRFDVMPKMSMYCFVEIAQQPLEFSILITETNIIIFTPKMLPNNFICLFGITASKHSASLYAELSNINEIPLIQRHPVNAQTAQL